MELNCRWFLEIVDHEIGTVEINLYPILTWSY